MNLSRFHWLSGRPWMRIALVAILLVSAHDREGYRLENVLFDSFPGWEVNATVYVPRGFAPPYPAVVVPVGVQSIFFMVETIPKPVKSWQLAEMEEMRLIMVAKAETVV